MNTKKQEKALAKREKKAAKAAAKSHKRAGALPEQKRNGSSPAVRYAELVRGILYLVTGGSLGVALLLGQRGAIVSLDDIIDGLFAALAGKAVLALIASALVIYGLKHLRVLR